MKDTISEVLDLAPIPKQTQIVEYVTDGPNTVRTDAELAKQNIRDLLQTGKETLEDLIEVARSSEAPRAYEVIATMMKQLADMNSQLLELYKKESEAAGPKKGVPGEVQDGASGNMTQINNTIFVGTTTELTKALERINNEHSQ